jgi:hypothetical protein
VPADITVRRGYLREPARDWQIRNVRLIAYRLPLA